MSFVRAAAWGLAGGAVVGGAVAVIHALVAKKKYEDQGTQLTQLLQQRAQQTAQTLQTSGSDFRTMISAVARSRAQTDAIGRASQLMRTYGLDSTTLAKLERYKALLT